MGTGGIAPCDNLFAPELSQELRPLWAALGETQIQSLTFTIPMHLQAFPFFLPQMVDEPHVWDHRKGCKAYRDYCF